MIRLKQLILKIASMQYCKFGNFREDYIFAKLAKFRENKTLAK